MSWAPTSSMVAVSSAQSAWSEITSGNSTPRALEEDRLVITGSTQQRQDPLAFAERIDPDQLTPLRVEAQRMQQPVDLVPVRRMAEHRQSEGRLGDEQIAALRLERRTGRVGAPLVVAGD